MECEVCFEEYDSGNHKPLCLACGHMFCFLCISSLPNDFGSTTKCPKCKKVTFQPVDDMSVVYALIPSENKPQRASRSQAGRSCPQHQKTLDYLCVDCMELVCFRCFKTTHAKHAVELVEDLLQGVEAVDARAVVRTKISGKLEPVNDMLSWIDELMNLNTDLKKWKDSLQDQKKTIEQDLQAWDGSVTEKDENKRRKYEEILSRLKSKPVGISELPEFKAKLDAASRKCEVKCNNLA
ncbi:E3 ubiquitin-protein ligase TRIM38-like [Hyalella azteca]|uniref:E3 ubiquitin-protein ligase TRIM38-like n=1 Tax=Hyalella azteca TaxID=294128 RepID=A0A8B7NTW9_HYAAZ|nr:E3 ubiquitin-protein ligase TRIM38-like [Hyalella azteca]